MTRQLADTAGFTFTGIGFNDIYLDALKRCPGVCSIFESANFGGVRCGKLPHPSDEDINNLKLCLCALCVTELLCGGGGLDGCGTPVGAPVVVLENTFV